MLQLLITRPPSQWGRAKQWTNSLCLKWLEMVQMVVILREKRRCSQAKNSLWFTIPKEPFCCYKAAHLKENSSDTVWLSELLAFHGILQIIINSEKIESKHVKPGWVPRDG